MTQMIECTVTTGPLDAMRLAWMREWAGRRAVSFTERSDGSTTTVYRAAGSMESNLVQLGDGADPEFNLLDAQLRVVIVDD